MLKKQFYLHVFFILLFFTTSVNASQLDNVRIRTANLIDVDYFGASIEIDLAETGSHNDLFVAIEIIDVNFDYEVIHGVRVNLTTQKVEFDVERLYNRDTAFTSNEIRVHVFNNDGFSQIIEDIPLTINWPGPESYNFKLGESDKDTVDFSSINFFKVIGNFSNSEKIIRESIAAGFPFDRIRKRTLAAMPVNHMIMIGSQVSSNAALVFTKILLDNVKEGVSIGITTGNRYSSSLEVLITDRPKHWFLPDEVQLISTKARDQISSEGFSGDDLYTLIGFSQFSNEEGLDELYKEASQLLDLGSRGNVEKARILLEKIISTEPDYARAYLELARVEMKSRWAQEWPQSLKKAENLIFIAQDIDVKLADANVLLGYVYTNQKRYKEAEEQYNIAESIGTDNLWLYANWGQNMEEQGLNTAAIDLYFKVINHAKIEGKNTRPRDWVFRSGVLFDLLAKEERYSEADALYEEHGNKIRNNCGSYRQAEIRLFYLKNPDGAIESYHKAKRRNCDEDATILSLAYYFKWYQLYEENINSNSAEKVLRQAEAFSTSDYRTFYELSKSNDLTPILIELVKTKNINQVGGEGLTALGKAVMEQKTNWAKTLLANGADPNANQDTLYYAPLLIAIENNDIDMIKLLLAYDADTDIPLPGGYTIEQYLKGPDFEEILDLVKKRNKT